MNPPDPTFIIFGWPVEAITISEFLQFPSNSFSSPIPADASSIVVIPLFLQYLDMDLMSWSAAYPAKLVKISAELSEMSSSSIFFGLISPKSVLRVTISFPKNLAICLKPCHPPWSGIMMSPFIKLNATKMLLFPLDVSFTSSAFVSILIFSSH